MCSLGLARQGLIEIDYTKHPSRCAIARLHRASGGSWYVPYVVFRERLSDFSVSGGFTAYFVRRPIVDIP